MLLYVLNGWKIKRVSGSALIGFSKAQIRGREGTCILWLMSSFRACTAGPDSVSCLIKGTYSAHAWSCCLRAGLEAGIELTWPEIPSEVAWAQRTEPRSVTEYIWEQMMTMHSRGTWCKSSGLEKSSLEKCRQLRLGNIPKALTLRRLNEDEHPVDSEDPTVMVGGGIMWVCRGWEKREAVL